jgi:asparagine synthase (glutamine-hydrolysing)
MCGISGIYAYGSRLESNLDAVIAGMNASMAHRGPDDAGVYVDAEHRVGLGFRRLAIIDLSSAGHQPMSNEDGSVWLVFNGEIYNHGEYRAGLQAKGHIYRGHSDSETIVHLYEEYGEDCVHYLRGMFAFAIWDLHKKSLFLARDRIGVKPLYYAFVRGIFLFASEIKAILAFPGFSRTIDEEAFSHYLTFMIPPAPLTMFEGVRKLAAGSRMAVSADGNERLERYWDAIVPPMSLRSDEEYSNKVFELLDDSVRTEMMSDVPIGVLLSGGLDSSLIAALMMSKSNHSINTFSVGFERYERYNELHYAREVAHRLGTNHREVIISHSDALDYIPELVHSQDEPIADWVCIPLSFVSRLARNCGVSVVLVGEGADELFCGYPLYLTSLIVQRMWPVLSQVPQFVWKLGIRAGALLHSTGMQSGRKVERLMTLLCSGDGRFWGGALAIAGADKEQLLNTSFWRARPRYKACEVLDRIYGEIDREKPGADALERMIYFELKQRLAELLLMRVDKMTMSHSIEARVPYLDHHLVEFAMGIPIDAKLRERTTKAVLKRAAKDLVPLHIVNRPKQGFSAPVAEWFRNELASEVTDSLVNSQLVSRGYLNREALRALIADHRGFRADRSVQIWNLYNLEAWHRHWIS